MSDTSLSLVALLAADRWVAVATARPNSKIRTWDWNLSHAELELFKRMKLSGELLVAHRRMSDTHLWQIVAKPATQLTNLSPRLSLRL